MSDALALLPDEAQGFGDKVPPVGNNEDIVRLLFYPTMISPDGRIEEVCFSVDELVERNNKSLSVTRGSLLADKERDLRTRSEIMQKPEKNRHSFGYLNAICVNIRSIVAKEVGRVFKVVADPIELNGSLDLYHAKIARASPDFSKGFVRGYRDKLAEVFSDMTRFE